MIFRCWVFYSITLMNGLTNSCSFSIIYLQIITGFVFLPSGNRYWYRYLYVYLKHTSIWYMYTFLWNIIVFSWLIELLKTSSAILDCDGDSGHPSFSQGNISLDFTEKHIGFTHWFISYSVWLTSTFNFINPFPLFSLCTF